MMKVRSAVFHADDLGMSHGANAAFAELSAFGTITAGSVMVPCPWFSELAAMARADPTLDIGVHLTLTSEMPGYRWRPLTHPPASAGLTDPAGYFHAEVATLRRLAQPAAVEAELRAQIDAALAAGIDVTHLDDHMGAVLAPEFAEIYVRIATDYRLPLVMCPAFSAYGGQHNLQGVTETAFAPGVALARSTGQILFDRIAETNWHPNGPPGAAARAMITRLPEGLSFLALHVTRPGDIDAIDPGFHRVRTAEYAHYRREDFRDWLVAQDISLQGMRPLRAAFRAPTERNTTWTASASA